MTGAASLRADLVEEMLPVLHDVLGDDHEPHPDGRPWRKCCGECAFLPCDPQGYGARGQADLRGPHDGLTFYCLHRRDDGLHRVCASYAAIARTRARLATPDRAGTGSGATAGEAGEAGRG